MTGELEAFTVEFETTPAPPRAAYYRGARRVFAQGDGDAVRRGRRYIAADLAVDETAVKIFRVSRTAP